jgi:hypothetical protein
MTVVNQLAESVTFAQHGPFGNRSEQLMVRILDAIDCSVQERRLRTTRKHTDQIGNS